MSQGDVVGQSAGAAAAAAASGAAALVVDLSTYWLGVPLPIVLAAFAGSCVSLSYVGSASRLRAFGVVISSTLMGAYIVPLIVHTTGMPPSTWIAIAFCTGVLGHTVGAAVTEAAPQLLRELIEALTRRIRGGR